MDIVSAVSSAESYHREIRCGEDGVQIPIATYKASVIEQDVETVVADDGGDFGIGLPDGAAIGYVELDDVQSAFRCLLQVGKRGCFRGISAGCDDDVGRVLE